MDNKYNAVGERILMLRKERELTRERLAEMSDFSPQFLSDIEKGRKNMTLTTLRKLSKALVVSTDFIVNGICDTDNELVDLCRSLNKKQQEHAAKLLRLYMEAIK
ncbi:MAG: helix-turn-helix transcriptional regulator [Firmicutes bacterium]|nr:helix-turn-helix transcriptional regulator [Bacillota bacterium]